MEFEKLTAQVRTGRKKGVARRLRRDGFIPAVCYGREMSPLAVSLDPKALTDALGGPMGRNIVIQLSVDGEGAPNEPVLVMLQDYQYHPVSRAILHADFIQVTMDQKVRVQVPFILTGKSIGVQAGGVLAQVFRSLPLKCRPDAIPGSIELDVSELELGMSKKVSDLDLPENVEIEFDLNQTLVSVNAPTVVVAEVEEEEEIEGEGEGEEAAEGEEAPPAE
jgi:large subunit ribosomal protein L25